MPIDPFTWIILAAFVGCAVGYFWDEIKVWATRVIGYILDAIIFAIEVTSDAIVYLVKEGRRFYKRVEVFVRNTVSGSYRKEYRQQEVPEYDIPDELKEQLEVKSRVKVMQRAT